MLVFPPTLARAQGHAGSAGAKSGGSRHGGSVGAGGPTDHSSPKQAVHTAGQAPGAHGGVASGAPHSGLGAASGPPAGAREVGGPPAGKGPLEQSGPPAGKGPPAQAPGHGGPPAGKGPLEQSGPPAGSGPSVQGSSPDAPELASGPRAPAPSDDAPKAGNGPPARAPAHGAPAGNGRPPERSSGAEAEQLRRANLAETAPSMAPADVDGPTRGALVPLGPPVSSGGSRLAPRSGGPPGPTASPPRTSPAPHPESRMPFSHRAPAESRTRVAAVERAAALRVAGLRPTYAPAVASASAHGNPSHAVPSSRHAAARHPSREPLGQKSGRLSSGSAGIGGGALLGLIYALWLLALEFSSRLRLVPDGRPAVVCLALPERPG
jgi:hypothetical protein